MTSLDHDSNIRPWVQAAERVGATVRWAEFDPATGELAVDAVEAVLGHRTRLVAVTAASNLIGTRPPVAEIGRVVHDAGALMYVDGVHYTAHVSVDVPALGADFFSCSPYKFLGPIAECSSPTPPSWRPCGRTSCCLRRWTYPSGSSWARCRMS